MIDLTGRRFGRYVVQKYAGVSLDRHRLWECLCDCGNSGIVNGKDLLSGHSKSCGCLQKDTASKVHRIHGDRDARLYNVWKKMKQRCENKSNGSYCYYGMKGVRVCEEWQNYQAFKKWAFDNGYDPLAKQGQCTIDRIDPYGDYEPCNCRWVSMAVQNRNKRKPEGGPT